MRTERQARAWITAALLVSCLPAVALTQIRVMRLSPLGVPVSPIGVAVPPTGVPMVASPVGPVVPSTERPVSLPRGPALLPTVVPNQPVVPSDEQPEFIPIGPRLLPPQTPEFEPVSRAGVVPQNYSGPALLPIRSTGPRLTPIFFPYP